MNYQARWRRKPETLRITIPGQPAVSLEPADEDAATVPLSRPL
ncbi:MAG: hypothetical protein ACOC98_02045 [Thermodesulfobacteriota bacterium]